MINFFKKIYTEILIVMSSAGTYAAMLAEELVPNHLTYIILTMFIMFTSLLTLIEGIYKSQGILFESKDNDLLFSLPISKPKIFFTRVFKMITFQFLYNSLFMLPAIVVYAMYEKPNVSFYILSLVMLLLLPIIPTIVACIIGYIIKGVTSRLKARNLIQVILTSCMLLFIFYVSFNMEGMVLDITQNANSINEVITKIYYPAGLYINLIQNFNILDLIILLASIIMPTFTALVGILINLRYPKMDWTSDTEVVKQSMSSMISVFIGMFVAILSITIIIIGSTINLNLFIILELLVFSIIVFILWKCLKKYGVRRFKEINV